MSQYKNYHLLKISGGIKKWKGGPKTIFISSVLINHRFSQRNICLLHGKIGFLKKIWANKGTAPPPSPLNPTLLIKSVLKHVRRPYTFSLLGNFGGTELYDIGLVSDRPGYVIGLRKTWHIFIKTCSITNDNILCRHSSISPTIYSIHKSPI